MTESAGGAAMGEEERRALVALRISAAPTDEDVWSPPHTHVDGLHGEVADAIMEAYREAADSDPSPRGVVITGRKGAGKTHLLGWVRTRVQRDGGYFFLVALVHGRDFWQNVVHALVSGLRRPGADGTDQLTALIGGLTEVARVPAGARDQLLRTPIPTRQALDELVVALQRTDRQVGHTCRHTVRALALLAAEDLVAQDVGESYLTSASEARPGERADWGIPPDAKPAQQVVREISHLLALTGPSLIAVDQIDTLIAPSGGSTDALAATPVSLPMDTLLETIGIGLMDLRNTMHRAVTVVACLPHVWEGVRSRSVDTVADRFRRESRLANVPSAAVGRALVEAHFGPRFAHARFDPPYPSWPVLPEAFADARRFTPRGLFRRIDAHIDSCLHSGRVAPLMTLDEIGEPVVRAPEVLEEQPVPTDRLAALDQRFTLLTRAADLRAARDPRTEDEIMPGLLAAGLRAWVEEQGAEPGLYELDPPPGAKPALHARLRRNPDESVPEERRWCFRSISGRHHKTVQAIIDRVRRIAGPDPAVTARRVYLLQAGEWSQGPMTRRMVSDFRADGGDVLPLETDDVRTFAALQAIEEESDPDLAAWLRLRRPAGGTALFRAVFGEQGSAPAPASGTSPPPARPPPGPSVSGPPLTIALGCNLGAGTVVRVTLESLRKHTAIFAGSGSGKTVLIRRLVEECALHGVSSIVLDPNNDLARLGEPWPDPPESWGDGDAAKAAEYIAGTEVVVWTPRRDAGRPLSLQPLPDFAGVREDPDEFALALDSAVAALAPRARMDGATARAERGRAVLREALEHFARHGGSGLHSFLDLLAELPEGVTPLAKAAAIAEDLAQTLTAARINDPLFGGSGVPLDPGVLLTPRPGRRARVSVISMIGLPTNGQRQSFVNQLQMALFSWIKQHPASDRPLGGLFVLDEAQTLAPSGALTACTESTLALASQARKYGLGLVFATQAPRGVHNRIVGNAATQLYGFLNSPTQVAAAKEMARAKASTVVDISRLTAGEFYAVSEGVPFQKVAAPMCLSHHPRSPLTTDEVLARARGGA